MHQRAETTIMFPMERNDILHLSQLEYGNHKDGVRFVCDKEIIEGHFVLSDIFDTGLVKANVFEFLDDNILIEIPLKVMTVNRKIGFDVVYGIGESQPVIITDAMRARYNALRGLRAYISRLTNCVNAANYDFDFSEPHPICEHDPNSHTENGCNVIVDWTDDGGRIYCPCSQYLKPAPLALI